MGMETSLSESTIAGTLLGLDSSECGPFYY
jgi:hypothetical protein